MQIENIFLEGLKSALYLAQSNGLGTKCEWCLNVPAFIKSCMLKCRNNISERFFYIFGMFYPQTPPVKPVVVWNSVTLLPKLPETIRTTHPFGDVLLEHKQMGTSLQMHHRLIPSSVPPPWPLLDVQHFYAQRFEKRINNVKVFLWIQKLWFVLPTMN